MYYNWNKLLSINAIIYMIIGRRSKGKTYRFKKKVIKNFLKKGEQFVYIRRWKTELTLKNNFFDDISEKYNLEFTTKGFYSYCREVGTDKWLHCGYFIPLSAAATVKSASFKKVTYVGFDEFIIENRSRPYIADEVSVFLNLIDTIIRDRTNVKVILMANAGAVANPYFRKYGITPKDFENKEIVRKMNGNVAIQMIPDDKHESDITRVSTQEYKEFANSNKFIDNTDTFILEKINKKEYQFLVHITDGVDRVDLYKDNNTSLYWVNNNNNNNSKIKGDIISCRKNIPIANARYLDKYLKHLLNATYHNKVTFNSPQTRELWYQMLK